MAMSSSRTASWSAACTGSPRASRNIGIYAGSVIQ
jgi:hypothetical protein